MPARSCTGVTSLLCLGRVFGFRRRPVTGLALGPQLLAGPGLGVHPLAVLAALLRPGGARRVLRLLQARVAAAGPEELGAGDHGRLPVEDDPRSEEHTSELQSRENLVCRLLH